MQLSDICNIIKKRNVEKVFFLLCLHENKFLKLCLQINIIIQAPSEYISMSRVVWLNAQYCCIKAGGHPRRSNKTQHFMEKTYQNQTQPNTVKTKPNKTTCESLWKSVKTSSTTPIVFWRLHYNGVLLFWELLVKVKLLLAEHWQPLPWPGVQPRLLWCNLSEWGQEDWSSHNYIPWIQPLFVFKRNTHPHPIIYQGAKVQRCVCLNGLHQQWSITFYSEDMEGLIVLAEDC